MTVNVSGLFVEVSKPDQLPNVYPVFATAVMVTDDPELYQGPAGVGVTDPPPVGLTAVITWYWVCQFHVMLEFSVIVKVVDVVVPEAGTDPVPVHPVHTYRVPVGPVTGEETDAVTEVPFV